MTTPAKSTTTRTTRTKKTEEETPSTGVTTDANPVDDRKNAAADPDIQRVDEEGRPLDGAPSPSGAILDPKAAPNATAPGALPTAYATGTQDDAHGGKHAKSVKDLHAEDLVDQTSGAPRPVSAQTKNLSATVSGDNGRVLVKLSVRGYIGEEPVVLLGEDVNELREILDKLDKAADEQTKEHGKKK